MSTGNEEPEETWTVGHCFGYEDLTGTKRSLHHLITELIKFRRSDIITWTAMLIQVCGEAYGQSVEGQKELIDFCLDDDLASAAYNVVKADGRNVVIYRGPLWLVLQLAAIVCGEECEAVPDGSLAKTVGRLSLIAGDCLHDIELAHILKAPPPDLLLEWQAGLLLAKFEMMPDHNAIARAYSFWFDSMSDPNVIKKLEECGEKNDLNPVFLAKFELSLSEFFFALFTLYKFLTATVDLRPLMPTLLTASGPWWGAISLELREKVLGMLSVEMNKFPAHLLGKPRQSWATDFSHLMARPLIEVSPGVFVCPDIGYFRSYFMDSVYWMFDEALAGKEWGNVFGAMFEWYIKQSLETAMSRREETKNMFFSDVAVQGKKIEACDCLIMDATTGFLFECKGTRLTSRPKSFVSLEETIGAIKKSVGSEKAGVGQLAKNVAGVLKGSPVISKGNVLDVAKRPRIVAVLVWYEESAITVPVRILLDEIFYDLVIKECPHATCVGPLLVLSPHDIEFFEQCSHLVSPDILLNEYADFVSNYPRDPRSTFLRYAYWRFSGQYQQKGAIGDKYDNLVQKFKQEHARRQQTEEPQS